MQYEFAGDKLRAAVLILARDDGTLQERLALAYERQLQHVVAADVPVALRQRLADIHRAIGAPRFGALKLADDQARRLAADIAELHAALVRAAGD